jgi:hypothetical protein
MSKLPVFTIDVAPQGSPEWLAARAGYVTGSRAHDVIAVRKDGKTSAARQDYIVQLVAERLTGQPQETGVVTPWMARGTELEPEARLRMEALIDEPIYECGFIQRRLVGGAEWAYLGCSVDGFFGGGPQHGIVELKCPKPTTHLRTWKAGGIPEDYWPQVLHNLLVTHADVCWWGSYCPQMPAALQFYAVRVDADDPAVRQRMSDYQTALSAFLVDVDDELTYWRTRGAAD